MEDGVVITENKNDTTSSSKNDAGGVFVAGGSLTMNDGQISGNTGGCGGGVNVGGSVKKSYFLMKGGAISKNSALQNPNYSAGGGVFVNGCFTMRGGVIGGTASADANRSKNGGGVFLYAVDPNKVTIEAGTISFNHATIAGGALHKDHSSYGVFEMNGGLITKNTADSNSGGIFLNGVNGVGVGTSSVHKNAGTIIDNTPTNQFEDDYVAPQS
jgi:hypothetical protein